MNTNNRGNTNIRGLKSFRQTGFSLLEVVITMFIISIGLLGLASMQATGLNNNNRAYQRSQATVLAYDIADRMRANTSGINGSTTTVDKYLTSFMAPTAAAQQNGCIIAGACSTADMAQNDLYEWNIALTTALPGSNGTVTAVQVDDLGCMPAVATSCLVHYFVTVNVKWDDDRSGTVDNADPGFQMVYRTKEILVQP